MGDFNSILGAHEQRGGGLPNAAACDDFRNWSDNCMLTHLPTRGATFTWYNRRRSNSHTERRLDRALYNEDWLSSWSSTSCCSLTRSNSDHHPLLVVLNKGIPSFPSSFKFQRMWIQHSDCRRLVLETWNKEVVGCPMFMMSQKLKLLKYAFKSWNKETFGNVHNLVEASQSALDVVQQQIDDKGLSDDIKAKELEAQKELQLALSFQEEF